MKKKEEEVKLEENKVNRNIKKHKEVEQEEYKKQGDEKKSGAENKQVNFQKTLENTFEW